MRIHEATIVSTLQMYALTTEIVNTHTHVRNIQNTKGNKKVGLRLILVKYLHTYIYIYIYDDDITCNHGNTVNKLVSIFFSGTFLGGKILRGGQLVGQILSRCHMAECNLKNLNGTTKIKI